MTTPRDELVQELAYVVGYQRAEQLADAHAHQLAEQIRKDSRSPLVQQGGKFQAGSLHAADLIDPEVRQ